MKRLKLISLILIAVMMFLSVTSCDKTVDTSVTSGSTTESTLDTMDRIRITDDIDGTTDISSAPAQETVPEEPALGRSEQLTANTFLTNFTEQFFYTSPDAGSFDVSKADIKELLRFVFLHIKINSYKDLSFEDVGDSSFACFTFDKARSVIVKYFARGITEEECKNLPAPPASYNSASDGPFYRDGKIYFIDGAGDTYRDIAIVNSADYNSDGTVTFRFTVYTLDYDIYTGFPDPSGIKTYYTYSPYEAEAVDVLTKSGTGVAVADIGQSGNYLLRTYEVNMMNNV